MLLERYVDLGILLERMMTLARDGHEVKLYHGIIEIDGIKEGVEGIDYTFDNLERAIYSVTRRTNNEV